MRRQIDIENLLRWAFVNELGKGSPAGIAGAESAWGMISGLGVRVDGGGWRPGMGPGGCGYVERFAPHRDALLIGEAVRDLAGVELGGFEAWDAFGDVPELSPHLADIPGRLAARLSAMPADSRREMPVALVVAAAVTGRAPDWRWPDRPTAKVVTRGGKPAWFVRREVTDALGRASTVEVQGYDARRGRPMPGAYRRYRVEPDPFGVALSRMDWQVWVLSLGLLVEALAGALADWEAVPAMHSPAPWVDGEATAAPRILEVVR